MKVNLKTYRLALGVILLGVLSIPAALFYVEGRRILSFPAGLEEHVSEIRNRIGFADCGVSFSPNISASREDLRICFGSEPSSSPIRSETLRGETRAKDVFFVEYDCAANGFIATARYAYYRDGRGECSVRVGGTEAELSLLPGDTVGGFPPQGGIFYEVLFWLYDILTQQMEEF